MNKIIYIDWNIFTHGSAFAWSGAVRSKLNLKPNDIFDYKQARELPLPPASYTCLRMVISNLKLIGVDRDDLIIIAVDGRGNWRKDLMPDYKGQRKEKREQSGIPWKELWNEFNDIRTKLYNATDFLNVCIDTIEADDIMAVGCEYFENNLNVFMSYDSDLEQLWNRPNVRIFSPHSSKKTYKIPPKDFNPYMLLGNKIYQEKKENINTAVQTVEEYEQRNMVKNLIDLPQFVKDLINSEIKTQLEQRHKLDINKIPFTSIRRDFESIYNSDKIINYNECLNPKPKIRKKREKTINF